MIASLVIFTLFHSVLSDFNLLLLHHNDIHGHLQQAGRRSELCPDDSSTACYGGFARLRNLTAGLTEEAAISGRSTVYLNAGDTFQGTPFYTFYKWKIMAEFVDKLGLDVMSLGNHDFDDGISGLVPFIKNVSVPIVCANLNTSLEPDMDLANLTPSYVLDVNGTKIGIIGYLTQDTKLISNPGKIQFLDEISSIKAEAENLTSQGVKILIALGHSGYTKDQEIAKEVTEIDLVVGGHSHTFLYNGTPPDIEVASGLYPTVITQDSGKQVPVVQAYKHTKYLGYLELDFDDDGNLLSWSGQPILLNGSYTQDSAVLKELEPYEEEVYARVDKVLGESRVLLDDDNMKCMTTECNFGNLITDAYVDYVTRNYNVSTGWTMAAVGLVHAGEISDSVAKNTSLYGNGSLTIADLYAALYPTASVAVINVTGEALLQALETSVARYAEADSDDLDEFLQVSGLKVVYDVGLESGSRVVSVDVLCADCEVPEYQPLQLNQTYGVVLPHTLSGGNQGYSMLVTYDPLILDDIEYMVVAEYIDNQGVIYPAVEGRILITNSSTSSSTKLMTAPLILAISLFAHVT